MCLTCGCGEPHNDHGDPRHITVERLRDAADAAGITVRRASKNLRHGVKGTPGNDEPPNEPPVRA